MRDEPAEKLARKLARWDEARTVIASRFNHDLRAPLTAIVGFAELLSEENLTPQQQVYVQRILEAIDKIMQILDEVQRVLNEVERQT